MKILLDENLPQRLRTLLPGHDVVTVNFMGWKGVENGALLKLAASEGFDLLITQDAGMKYQISPAAVPISVAILVASSNTLEDIEPLLPELLERIAAQAPRTIIRIGGVPMDTD